MADDDVAGGDIEGAAQTQFELQMEYMDGGMPGNTIAKELEEEVSEWIGQYGDDVVDFVSLYGDDAIDLIRRYKGDAIEIIRDFGDDGIQLLQKYGDNAVSIFMKYGGEGVDILKRYGDDGINFLTTYGDDAIEIIGEHGEEGIKLLRDYSDDAISFSKRCKKLGVDPTSVLDNPPKSDQSLEGWLLEIDNPENPVNMPLKLNLSDAEITDDARASILNPDSKLFSIGYGESAEIPYDELATHFGPDYKMSYFSLTDERWAKYKDADAMGDFWQVNREAIEWGIEERKIFILNVDYDLATNQFDDISSGKFTFAEIRTIEFPENDYTVIRNGEHAFFVPDELLDSYQSYLPPALLNK